ncbi:MAG: aminoglycoside 6'-N-acetyltransferase [bacterium]|jgi:aminoglycoside 6'-N-acetyltransferase I
MKRIVKATEPDLPEWVRMGIQLWHECSETELKATFQHILQSERDELFLYRLDEEYAGFIHVSVRNDYVNGSTSTPTGYIEGIYVKPEYRKRHIGKELVKAGESWASERGCRQIGSDVLIGNTMSYEFHRRTGFREVERVICFIKNIAQEM